MKKPRAKGRVAFVGAGPGDTGLLTLRAREYLSRADVVIYDGLANIDMLRFAENAEYVHVGKNIACRSLKNYTRASEAQTRINQLLVRHAAKGKFVVRLKGGDPFVFGRGGEEAVYLKKHGIPFEVVPGVSAGFSVPAYAGIPVTDRSAASLVTFVTGHEDPEKSGTAVDWHRLAGTGGTLVCFMGLRNLEKICRQLTEGGRAKKTPAAVIEWGTLPKQRTITGTLATIAAKVRKARVAAPALIVIGEAAAMRRELLWFERKPLAGKTVLITRAQRQSGTFRQKLEDLGAEVLEYPAIQIEKPRSWKLLDHEIRRITQYDWVLLTSVNGVESFFDRAAALKKDARYFQGVKFGVIGEATRTALSARGIEADLMPPSFHSDSLFDALERSMPLDGKKILLARADIASKEIVKSLKAAGAKVTDVAAYRTLENKEGFKLLREWLTYRKIDYITFTSASTVEYFLKAAGRKFSSKFPAKLLSIGPVTTAALRRRGLRPWAEAAVHTLDGLTACLLKKGS